jgi:hypothetical protein
MSLVLISTQMMRRAGSPDKQTLSIHFLSTRG